MVKTTNIEPLKKRAFGVPISSAMAPKGTALRGIAPNVIIAMLMILPRISIAEYICMSVMFKDMKTAVRRPIINRKGNATA